MRASWLALSLVCCAAPASPPPTSALVPTPPSAPAHPTLPAARVGLWTHDLCEPSALLWTDAGWLIGDNETEDGLYLLDATLQPTRLVPLAPGGAARVEDIEALTPDWVVGSHSRSGKDKGRDKKPDRFKLLDRRTGAASTMDLSGVSGPDGERLRAAQEAKLGETHPGLDPFNIEGAARVGDDLLLGLRGPRDEHGAAMVLVATPTGTPGPLPVARVLHLDLGGEGVRELTPWAGGLLVVSGPADADRATTPTAPQREHHLWWWPSPDQAATRLDVTLPPSTEGLWPIDGAHVLVVIDGAQADDAAPGAPQPTACKTAGGWQVVDVALPKPTP